MDCYNYKIVNNDIIFEFLLFKLCVELESPYGYIMRRNNLLSADDTKH